MTLQLYEGIEVLVKEGDKRRANPILIDEHVVRGGEPLQALREMCLEVLKRFGRPSGLPGDCLDHGEQIF